MKTSMKNDKSNRDSNFMPIVTLAFVAFDLFIWWQIFSSTAFFGAVPAVREYFLDVGQGDSELIVFPGNIKIMTDAGPDNAVLTSLARVMPSGDSYIDLAVISHPDLDHFGGYNFILGHYRIGAFIYNGRGNGSDSREWVALMAAIKERNIPLVTLARGDNIRIAANEIDMLSPNPAFVQSVETNDTTLIELVKTPGLRTLLTGDAGFSVEDWLLANHVDVRADILKVGHHGSNYTSGSDFLRAVNPKVAVVEVGAKNTYGQPGKANLARIASSTHAIIFRTDWNGTIEIHAENGKLKITKER